MLCCVFCLHRSWEDKRRDWLLSEAKLFTAELLKDWHLGHCTEDVIVLYSLDDGVVSSSKNMFYCSRHQVWSK